MTISTSRTRSILTSTSTLALTSTPSSNWNASSSRPRPWWKTLTTLQVLLLCKANKTLRDAQKYSTTASNSRLIRGIWVVIGTSAIVSVTLRIAKFTTTNSIEWIRQDSGRQQLKRREPMKSVKQTRNSNLNHLSTTMRICRFTIRTLTTWWTTFFSLHKKAKRTRRRLKSVRERLRMARRT